MRLNMQVAGADPRGGYGKLKLALTQALLDQGVDVLPVHMGVEHDPADVTLIFGTPENITLIDPTPARAWLYTMAESDTIRPCWIERINRDYERVLVPCPELVTVFERSGCTVPVHYALMGVDFSLPTVVDRSDPAKRVFLTYSLGDSRKGADVAIMAFKAVFYDRPNYDLWIKCTDPRGTWLNGCEDEQIKVIAGALSEDQWFDLLSRADAFVFASRGEGFGLPPREATLAGVPTVCPPFLGLWDVSEWGYSVDIEAWRPVLFNEATVNADNAKWADPSVEDTAAMLAWIDAHPDEARDKARRGREYLLSNFSWERAAARVIELLKEYEIAPVSSL